MLLYGVKLERENVKITIYERTEVRKIPRKQIAAEADELHPGL
jgi:hypothetical protein